MSRSLPDGTAEAPVLQPGLFEGVSDERLEAELRAAGLLVSGSGGHGNRGPDSSGGGGGDGDGWDDEEWPRRHRHSRAVRVMALATASLLALGTAGAWISLAVDANRLPFPATVTVVGERVPAAITPVVSGGQPAASAKPAKTTFTLGVSLTNRSGSAATPECVLLVDAGGHQAEGAVVFHRLANGASASRTLALAVPGAPASVLPETAVACGAR